MTGRALPARNQAPVAGPVPGHRIGLWPPVPGCVSRKVGKRGHEEAGVLRPDRRLGQHHKGRGRPACGTAGPEPAGVVPGEWTEAAAAHSQQERRRADGSRTHAVPARPDDPPAGGAGTEGRGDLRGNPHRPGVGGHRPLQHGLQPRPADHQRGQPPLSGHHRAPDRNLWRRTEWGHQERPPGHGAHLW